MGSGRSTGAGLVCGLVALVAGCGGERPAPAEPRPPRSLILISIDSLRADHVGYHGYERATTPALDRLAAEAWVFERAYTTVSWTLPAHMSLLTGLYPSQHGVTSPKRALAAAIPTLAERLRRQGHQTLGFFNPEWLDGCFGFDRGFDVYRPHADAGEADRNVRRALGRRARERPFFLFVHLYDVHTAPIRRAGWTLYEPPRPYRSMFLPDAAERVAQLDTFELWRQFAPQPSVPQREAIAALYDGGIRYVDDTIGAWIEDWAREGLLDEALVIVTADHGEGLGQHVGDHYGGHGAMYEEGLRVPLLMRFPDGRLAGRREAAPVSHTDLVPTILDWLGCEPDTALPGYSLLAGRPPGAVIHAEDGDAWASLRWPLKVIAERGAADGLVYDLERDPGETASLRATLGAEGARELVAPIQSAAREERARWAPPREPIAITPDAAMRVRLEALGYGGDD